MAKLSFKSSPSWALVKLSGGGLFRLEAFLPHPVMGDRVRHVVTFLIGQRTFQYKLRPAGSVRIRTDGSHLLRTQGTLHGDVRVGGLQELLGPLLEDRRIGRHPANQRQPT